MRFSGVCGGVLGVAVACVLAGDRADARLPRQATAEPAALTLDAPPPTGPYAVGRRLVRWVDESRQDPLDDARPRELMVWTWYPAGPAATPAREPALAGTWGEQRLETLEARLGRDFARATATLRVSARTDAPLADRPSRLPVLLFTPGLGWLASDYSVLVEDLASHGYLVVGLAPTGFADIVRFPDGREVRRTLGVGPKVGTDQAHVHQDALFALQQIRRLDEDATSFLRGRLDLTRIGALGHSLGGTTAMVAAARDAGVGAAVNIDGDPMGEVLDVRPRQPLLLISSESPSIGDAPAHPSAEHIERVRQGLERSERRRTNDWAQMSSGAVRAYRVRVLGTRHLNFTDAALASATLVTPEQRWMRMGPIPGRRGLEVTAALVRGFFDWTLLGKGDGEWLRRPERRFPEARLEARTINGG